MKYLYFEEDSFIDFPSLMIPEGAVLPLLDNSDIREILQTNKAIEITEGEYKAVVAGEYTPIRKKDIQEIVHIGIDADNDCTTYIYGAKVSPALKERIVDIAKRSRQLDESVSLDSVDTIAFEQTYFTSGSPAYCDVWLGLGDLEILLTGEINDPWNSRIEVPNFNQALAIAIDRIEDKDIPKGHHFTDYTADYPAPSMIRLAKMNWEEEQQKPKKQDNIER